MGTQKEADDAISNLVAQVERSNTVSASATVLIGGFNGRMQKALDDFKAANPSVSDAQVAGLQSEITASQSSTDALAAAVAANTVANNETPTPDSGGVDTINPA